MRRRPDPGTIASVETTVGSLTTTWLAALSLWALGATSLAPNAGLEQGTGDQPAAWQFYSWQASRGWWADEHAHTGTRSLGLRGVNGGWSAELTLEPGAAYRVSGWYRAEGQPRIAVFGRPKVDGKYLNGLYLVLPTIPADQPQGFVAGELVEGPDEHGWVAFDAGTLVMPANASELSLLFKVRGQSDADQLWLDDLAVEQLPPRQLPPTGRLLASLPDAAIWTDYPEVKILPSASPPTATTDGIELSAAQGESEACQLAVRPGTVWRDVTWRCTGLPGPLRVRRIETIPIEHPNSPFGIRGDNPDPLTDRLPCDLPANRTQGFWLTCRVSVEQAPGDYRGKLELLRGDRAVATVPLKLTVRAFEIPARPSLEVRSAFRADLALAREQDDPTAVLHRYYESYLSHRTRCDPGVLPKVSRTPDGWQLDASGYLAELRWMKDHGGLEQSDLPLLWIGHRGTHRMPSDASWRGQKIFANAALSQLDPAFAEAFGKLYRQLCGELREAGLWLSPSVRFFDEPNLDDPATLRGLRTLSLFLQQLEPEVTLTLTAVYPHPSLTDVIHRWVLHTDGWSRNRAAIEAARQLGCEILVYNNAVDFPEDEPIRTRLWPWLLDRYRVDGTYSWWGTVCWRGPMADPWTCGRGDSGVLLYPPRDGESGPIESVRWELFREGLEDYEYLHLARRLVVQLTQAGRADAARVGQQALQAADALTERWPRVHGANDEPYDRHPDHLAAVRARLAEAIELMQEALR